MKQICVLAAVLCAITVCQRIAIADGGSTIKRIVSIQATEPSGAYVEGLIFASSGLSNETIPTSQQGKTVLELPPSVQPGSFIQIQLVKQKYKIGSKLPPWCMVGGSLLTAVPLSTAIPIRVLVVRTGQLNLNDNQVAIPVARAVAREVKPNLTSSTTAKPGSVAAKEDPLQIVANSYGISVEQIMEAIKRLKTDANPYARGIAQFVAEDFAAASASLQKSIDESGENLADKYYILGLSKYQQGKYSASVDALRQSDELAPDNYETLDALAMAYAKVGKLEAAENAELAAINKAIATLGNESPELASLRSNQAVIKMTEGERPTPIPIPKSGPIKSLKDRVTKATRLNNIGCSQKNPTEAQANFQQALDLLNDPLDRAGKQTLTAVLNNLASIYDGKEHFELAENMYRRALSIDRELYPGKDGHPDTARDLNNLGKVLLETHRLEEAKAAFTECLKIRENFLNGNQLSLVPVYVNLASVYNEDGDMRESDRLNRLALAILLESRKKDPKSIGQFLGLLFTLQSRYSTAETDVAGP